MIYLIFAMSDITMNPKSIRQPFNQDIIYKYPPVLIYYHPPPNYQSQVNFWPPSIYQTPLQLDMGEYENTRFFIRKLVMLLVVDFLKNFSKF